MLTTDRPRLATNRDRVLARLLQGPATNHELREIGGARAMGRVWELQHDYAISVTPQHKGTWLVVLKGKRQPEQMNLELAS